MGENHNNRRREGGNRRSQARREERRAAREAVMALLFETEYHEEDTPEAIYLRAAEARELDPTDRYIHRTYMGVMEHLEVIDAVIGRNATGWRTGRLSRVSRAVLRLGTYELIYEASIPAPIAINEAVELSKKFDDPKARAFVNGVLNAIKNELAENGGVWLASEPATKTEHPSVTAETEQPSTTTEAADADEAAETASAGHADAE